MPRRTPSCAQSARTTSPASRRKEEGGAKPQRARPFACRHRPADCGGAAAQRDRRGIRGRGEPPSGNGGRDGAGSSTSASLHVSSWPTVHRAAGRWPRGRLNYPAAVYSQSVAAADVNGDGRPDLAAANYLDGDVSQRKRHARRGASLDPPEPRERRRAPERLTQERRVD
ncbi:FG-GAP repeat protein [Sorangium sp. Soce836]|uniref:FG-GAP repeat protein n=1 Tax=Sorangium TaxID=39643 RepID=UPI0038B43AFB